MDAYTPYSVEGLAAALGMRRSPIPSVVFIGGLTGAAIAFWMQYYSMSIELPVQRRRQADQQLAGVHPDRVRGAGADRVVLGGGGHGGGLRAAAAAPPGVRVPSFARASQDRFFLCIEAVDPLFDRTATARFLLSLAPHDVVEVPQEELIEATPAEEHSSVRLSEEAYQTPTAVGAK